MTAYVGIASNYSASSDTALSTSTSISVTAGDLILVHSKWEGATTTDTVTDNASGGSNTYTERASRNHTNSDLCGRIHGAVAKASETLTFTQTLGAARPYRKIFVIVHSPTSGKTFAYDNAATAEPGQFDSPKSSGSYSVAGVGGVAVASFCEYGATTWAPGTGWTERIEVDSGYLESRILTSETSIAGEATDDNIPCLALSVAYKEESAGDAGAAGAATAGAGASAALDVVSRQFSFTLYNVDGTTPLAGKTGLWWAWWPSIAAVRTDPPDASGTGASTNGTGVFTVSAPGTLSVGENQGFGIISDQDSTPDATEAAYAGSFDVV